MTTIRYDKDTGRVTMVSIIDAPKPGDISVDALPPEPAPNPPYAPVLYVRDGKPVWEMVKMEDAPDNNAPLTEPAQEEQKTPPEVLRREAYKRHADQHLIAALGYEAEGNAEAAAAEREQYLAIKQSIRAEFPPSYGAAGRAVF